MFFFFLIFWSAFCKIEKRFDVFETVLFQTEILSYNVRFDSIPRDQVLDLGHHLKEIINDRRLVKSKDFI